MKMKRPTLFPQLHPAGKDRWESDGRIIQVRKTSNGYVVTAGSTRVELASAAAVERFIQSRLEVINGLYEIDPKTRTRTQDGWSTNNGIAIRRLVTTWTGKSWN